MGSFHFNAVSTFNLHAKYVKFCEICERQALSLGKGVKIKIILHVHISLFEVEDTTVEPTDEKPPLFRYVFVNSSFDISM